MLVFDKLLHGCLVSSAGIGACVLKSYYIQNKRVINKSEDVINVKVVATIY
jgi:hypothetical protein